MATIRERLTDFALSQGFRTLSGFEKACGFTKNTLTKDYSGLSSTTLTKIVDKYPQLSLDWVILGRGQMLVNGNGYDAYEEETITLSYRELKNVIVEAIKEAKR